MGTPSPPPKRGARHTQFWPMYCGTTACMDQDATWYGGRPQPRPHFVTWGPSSPPLKGAQQLPKFSAHVCCGQMAGWSKMPLVMEVGLSPGHIVLDGDPPHHHRRGTAPQFLAHVCYVEMAGWMKMPLVTDVSLGPGDIVLCRNPAPPKRGIVPPLFSPCLLWPNGWMDQGAMEVDLGPGHIVLDGAQPLSPPRKGAQQSTSFQPMSIVAKRSPISATAELALVPFWY